MARSTKTGGDGDDLGGQYARGEIDLSELNARASAAGEAVTTAEARSAAVAAAPASSDPAA